MKRAATVVAGAALAITLHASACPLPAPAMQSGTTQAAWTVVGGPIEVGRHFGIDIQLCPADAVLTRVDAVMPAHGHGMNYRPSVTPTGAGRWRATGLMFHMPGLWELRLDVRTGGRGERLSLPIELP